MKRRISIAVFCATLLATGLVYGQTSLQEAKTYFNAGAQAYDAGQFLAAIQAFEQAYKLSSKEAITFSIAQAYRRQFYLDSRPEHLKLAIEGFRGYLAKAPQGNRRADAALALTELEPLAKRASVSPTTSGPSGSPQAPTRLMVSSRTKGAKVSVDDGPPQVLPLIAETEPGKHKIRVTAEGRFDEEREVVTAEGSVVALDIPLRDKPARLILDVEPDVEVTVDGRPAGKVPLMAPLELTAGTHFVVLTRNGREPWAEEVDFKRGKSQKLQEQLELTRQRVVSFVVLGTGAAALVGGGVFTALAFERQKDAQDVKARTDEQNIASSEMRDYNNDIDKRDLWRKVAGTAFGAGLALGVAGVLLFAIDNPAVRAPALRVRQETDKSDEAPPDALEISAAPSFSSSFAGGSLEMKF